MFALQLTIFTASIHVLFALNDPDGSNYFISVLDVVAFGYELPIAYPTDICIATGIGANFAVFECSDDYQSITKHVYGPSDEHCTGSETETAVTYTMDASITEGYQGDFNCAGKFNAIVRDMYVFGCDVSVGILWSATEVCYKYLNLSNLTGNLGNFDGLATDYYQLSQINYCDECGTSTVTFIGEECMPSDSPLSIHSANASIGCGFFFSVKGISLYGEVLECIRDGEDVLNTSVCSLDTPTTTADGDGAEIKSHRGFIFVLFAIVLYIY